MRWKSYARWLRHSVRTEGFASWKNGDGDAHGSDADVEVDIEDSDDGELPTRRLLGKLNLLLQASAEFRLVEDAPGVVPEHRQPESLIPGKESPQVGLRYVWRFIWDRRGRKRGRFGGVESLPGGERPRVDGLVEVTRVVDGPHGLFPSWKRFMLRGQDSGVGAGEEGHAWPPCRSHR